MKSRNKPPVETNFGLMDDNITLIIALNSVRPSDSSSLMRFIKILIRPEGFAEVSSRLDGIQFGK